MPLVPFDITQSKWLESGEWVRVKDQTDSNYDREGAITDRTIYGGTVHFEDHDRTYRNDQLERLGQRQAVIWKLAEEPHIDTTTYAPYRLYCNDQCVGSNISYRIGFAAIEKLIKPGDTYIETDCDNQPQCVQTYEQVGASCVATRRFNAGSPDDDDDTPTEDDDQDLEPIDDIFAPPVPADWYPS